jgi:hypothetical protein
MSTSVPQTDIKKISVTGDTDVFGGVRQPKRGRSRKAHGGGESAQGAQSAPKITKEFSATATSAPAPAASSGQPVAVPAAIPVASAPTPAPMSVSQAGGKRPIKVVLNKVKITHKAVKLNPKKPQQHHDNSTQNQNKTKKSRKIILGIPGLKRRITIAQKIRHKTEQTPIEQLRAELVTKGLLKAGSKTPDGLVRQIAADAQILSKKGL